MSERILLTVVSFNTMAALLPVCMFVLWKKPQLWHTTLTVFLGVLTGFVNLQSREVILPVLLLLSFGFFLGFSRPQRGWLQAALLAIWVPIGEAMYTLFFPAGRSWLDEPLIALFAAATAAAGVYAGIVLRKFSFEPHQPLPSNPAQP